MPVIYVFALAAGRINRLGRARHEFDLIRMIGTIRRHQQWLWGVIIAATIFSFVYYLSPTQRYNYGQVRSGSGPDLGSVNGEAVTVEQWQAAERQAHFYFRLRTGAWPNDTEEQKKQIRAWAERSLMIDSLIRQYKVVPTTDAAARFAKQLLGVPPDQPLPADKFQDFVKNELMRKGGLTLDDFDRFVRNQMGEQYLASLFGLSGALITPKEAEFFCRRDNTPMVTEVVTFPTANYYGATAPTPAELQDFFTKHQAEYRLPDRIQINYVVFDPSNYTAQADKLLGTNLDERVDQYYHQQGPDSFKDESGKVLSVEAAQARIKKQMHQFAAAQEAMKDANGFLGQLGEGHDEAHPFSPSDLFKLAKTKGLAVKTTEPFDEQSGSPDLNLPPKPLHLLFSLRENDPDDADHSLLYVSSPLPGENAIYVAGLQKRLPSELRTLAQVHEEAVRDYRDEKALDLAREAGRKFAAAIQAGLTQGKSFDALCAAQNFTPQSLPPFALTSTNAPATMEKSDFVRLQETAYALPVGMASGFIPSSDGGFVVHVKQRLPVDEALITRQLPYYLAKLRSDRQMAAFQEWFGRQYQLHLVPIPSERSGAG
jgi:hypothetical protein